MRQFLRPTGRATLAAATTLLALAGCGGTSAPSVSSTSAEASVHGVVTYKGKPVAGGEISFNPANIQRRDAKTVTAPIGKDGTYTIKTLQGGNNVSFNVPAIPAADFSAKVYSTEYDVPSGDGSKDFEIPSSQ